MTQPDAPTLDFGPLRILLAAGRGEPEAQALLRAMTGGLEVTPGHLREKPALSVIARLTEQGGGRHWWAAGLSASQRVKAFEVQEAYGLVWVRLEAGDSQLPAFAAEGDEHLRKVNCGPYDVAASAPRIIENFLDMSHFGFVHEGWLGSRDATAIAAYKVETTPTGVMATGCKAVQPQSNLHSTQAAEVEYTYEVTAPYTAVLTKIPEEGSSKQGWREQIGLFICPITPESSRVWFRLAVADFESTDEQLQTFQHTIFVQDQPVLESQLPKALPLDPRAEMHSAADRMSSAYRRFLKSQAITFGVC